MINLTNEDINNALIFLNRVQLTGEESMAMVDIQLKLRAELSARKEAQVEPTPIEKGKKEA